VDGQAAASVDRFAFAIDLTWRSWLVLGWLAGIALQVALMLVQRRRLVQVLRRATPARDPELLTLTDDVAAQLGLTQRLLVLLSDDGAPFVSGMMRPVLVLPRGLLSALDTGKLRAVLLHELAHLERGDLWWGWLSALARLVYFFHPVAHWVAYRIRLERELACDQLAMAHSGQSAADYADVLVRVVSHASLPAALALSSPEGLSTFWKRRMTMLLATRRSLPRLTGRARLGLLFAALIAFLVPTLLEAPAQAPSPPGQGEAKSKGRLYVTAVLRYKAEGEDEEKDHYNLIIAVDPVTGKWQKITDKGHDGRVSPDGQTLLFARHQDGVWNCDTGGSNNPGKIFEKDGRPVWSPDGKHFVVTKQVLVEKPGDKEPRKTPSWKDETWKVEAGGLNPVKLPIPDTDSVEDWSPDGKWFVTCSDRHPPFGSGYQLYVMKTDGTEQRRLTQGGLNVYARFSPDSKKILYLRQTGKAGNSIWTMDVDGKNAKELLKEEGLVSPDGAYWSPDGKQIAVILLNWEQDEKGKKFMRAGSDVTNPRLVIMDADGTNRRDLPLVGGTFRFIGALGDWR
jgi:Tol biopolymer transport system component/beta-lactamase regulating signal transducer with metallopeptidase domain